MKEMNYRGFNIVKGIDCWGSESYFVYRNKELLCGDFLDCVSDCKEWIDSYIG